MRFGCVPERFEKRLDPAGVRVDQSVVENQRGRLASICQKPRESEPHENGDLLLRAVAKRSEPLGNIAADDGLDCKVSPKANLRAGKDVVQIRLESLQDRLEIKLARLLLDVCNRREQQVYGSQLSLEMLYMGVQPGEPLLEFRHLQ